MLRAILEDAIELAGLALFLAPIAIICAPDRAFADDGVETIAGADLLAGGIIAVAIVGVAAIVINGLRGDDVAAHENNDMRGAERAESIKGGER